MWLHVFTQADSTKKDKSHFQVEMKQHKLLEKEVSITGSNGFVNDPMLRAMVLMFSLDLYKIYYHIYQSSYSWNFAYSDKPCFPDPVPGSAERRTGPQASGPRGRAKEAGG